MASARPKELTKPEFEAALRRIDAELTRKKEKPLKIVLIGAATMLMLDIRDRGTTDIDLAPCLDAKRFQNIAEKLGFSVDIVSVTTTVDFVVADTREVFRGNTLCALSVNELDLLKLKLERFRKQDPADIDAIIKKFAVDYKTYKNLALEAAKDFVGNSRRFSLQLLQAAAEHYRREEVDELEKQLARHLSL